YHRKVRHERKTVFHPKRRMVGATGFEPATSCSQSKCSTRLSYAPTTDRNIYGLSAMGKLSPTESVEAVSKFKSARSRRPVLRSSTAEGGREEAEISEKDQPSASLPRRLPILKPLLVLDQ